MSAALRRRLEALEAKAVVKDLGAERTRFGIWSKDKTLLRVISDVDGEFIEVGGDPQVNLPEKLEPVLTRPKRFIGIFGGRGSGKSMSVSGITTAFMRDYGYKIGYFREYMNSIEDSVYSSIKSQINDGGMDGFGYTTTSITHKGGGMAKFKGLARNPSSIKSMEGFKIFSIEEAQTISDESLKLLTPTMREEGGSLIFVANPLSSEDPLSRRLISPFRSELDTHGIYEDDLHLIIEMNYEDNPWFPKELDGERADDKKRISRAMYDHIWHGAYNDAIENSLILAEWFDACIDAHTKLGFAPKGVKIAAHDPSDTGPDSKGYCLRHGAVILDVCEKIDGDINEGGDWATGLSIQAGADSYTWDCDGMGVGLNRQTDASFAGKGVQVAMFKGSESPDFSEAIYEPAQGGAMSGQKTIGDTFKNKRAQYYFDLRDRVYRTYRAVEHGEYQDPDKMISFSSGIDVLRQLRAELCRIPVKPNGSGRFELYTKEEMKNKFKVKSPNLADSVMMSLRHINVINKPAYIPRKSKPMGRR